MKRIVLSLMVVFLFALPVMASDFDAMNPPFGKELSKIDNADYFIKYMEKDGISYYNYIGPRKKDPMYEHSSPHIVYAFVQGKLYARIVRNWGKEKAEVLEKMTDHYGKPAKIVEEGDWSIARWNNIDGKDIVFKLKFNNKTQEVQSSHYYEPLRKLANAAE